MKKCLLPFLAVAVSLLSLPVFSQEKEDTTGLLGLPGDNLDLYAVLTVFQKSKTIEAFEKTLNDEQTKINNLDLNLDKKIDFIKVTTPKNEKKDKKDSSYSFILQVDVTKTETQDVAVILLNKENGRVSLQIVGDPELYGKDYVVEPKGNSSITANPGYTGADPVTVNVPATTTVVVQSAPIVQYVYSPAYVPYYPPYYYGYYPPYFAFGMCIAVGIYRSNNYYYHGGYHGGHYGGGNTVIINNGNRNQINNYNNSRNTSNTVANNKANGGYGSGNRGSSNRPSTGGPSAGASNRPSTGGPSAGTSNRPSTGGPSASTRQSSSTRPSTSNSSSGRTRSSSSGGYSGGGGGMNRSSGMSRGGGGGGRRR
ncbi:MAG TPA: hypothetical protein VIZ28_09975 [Chitinophagaceae bacterium]